MKAILISFSLCTLLNSTTKAQFGKFKEKFKQQVESLIDKGKEKGEETAEEK
jgi:hypothetical protein